MGTQHKEADMLVRERMTPNPVIIGPQAMLATALEYMTVGHFRRLPVIQEGTLVGMLTDRDIRRHAGSEERTKVQAAMTESPLTVPPDMPIEEATKLLLRDQISGLPVVEDGKLVGIITASDILNAFLEMTGATTPNSVRITLFPKEGGSLADAAKLIEENGGEVLGVGTHREPDHHKHGFFLRIRGLDATKAATALRQHGYTVR
jgi:acetoin utilization protein AcuB